MQLTDSQLEALLDDAESDRVERKESLRPEAPAKVREAICAFANDLPGHAQPGVVFVGVRNDGTLSGEAVSEELLIQLADMKGDGNIVPPPTLTVEKRRLRGGEVAVVTVLPSDSPPVRYKGVIWVRVGPRRGIATAQDERVLNERRRSGDRPFDIRRVRDASIAELDREVFEGEYLPGAFSRTVLEANERSYEQRLAATKMVVGVDDTTPTVLGLLVLSPRALDFIPGAYVQFLRIAGTTLAEPVRDEQAVSGLLSEVIRRIDEKLAAHNAVAVDITGGSRERRREDYPTPALHQIVRNAIMHRDYEGSHAPVRVTWFDDRIEILSPGGPFGAVTTANFGAPGVTDYRNPSLAEALRVLGFVQRFGVGIATARKELERNGNPPLEVVAEQSHVLITLRAAG